MMLQRNEGCPVIGLITVFPDNVLTECSKNESKRNDIAQYYMFKTAIQTESEIDRQISRERNAIC